MRNLGPCFARILIDLLYLFLKFRVAKAAKISWLTMQNKAHWMLEILESATRLRVLAKLRHADRVPGSKKFCNAWDWRLTLSTDLASILAVAVHRQHSFGQVVWTLVLYKASLTSMRFTLKGHNLCSRVFETMQIETLGITSASSALAARHGEGKTRKHAATVHVSVCVCVFVWCLCVVNTAVSLNIKI